MVFVSLRSSLPLYCSLKRRSYFVYAFGSKLFNSCLPAQSQQQNCSVCALSALHLSSFLSFFFLSDIFLRDGRTFLKPKMVEQLDISPNQDGAILKEVKKAGEDPNDKPWKGDRVSVVSLNFITQINGKKTLQQRNVKKCFFSIS